MEEAYYNPYNFGAIPLEYTSYDAAKVVVVAVPLESTTTYVPGTRNAPDAIMRASTHMELYDEEIGRSTYTVGIHTTPELSPFADLGQSTTLVAETVRKFIDDEKLVAVVGGEHSVTIGSVRAARERYRDLSVLYFDAHADLRDSLAGTRFNHACVARRLAELCPVVQVGIRSLSEAEVPLTNSGNVTTVFARDVRSGLDLEKVVEPLSPNVYISIDMDVFDPSVVPGVGTPEPGGLDWRLMNDILGTVCKNRRVCAFDVVEVCPIPGTVVSEYTAARLIYRLIGLIARTRGWFD